MPAQDIPAIDPKRSATLAEFGATLTPLEPIGAAVHGLNLASPTPPPHHVKLEHTMAERGFVVFKSTNPLSVTDFRRQAAGGAARNCTAPTVCIRNTRRQPASLSSVQ